MIETCECNDLTFGNTGRSNCEVISSVMRNMMTTPVYGSDGTRNKIDLDTDTLDDAYVLGKLNEADPRDRWYPTGELEAVVSERADNEVETLGSGRIIPLKPGVKNVVAQIVGHGPALMEEWEKMSCPPMAFFNIDRINSLRGMEVTKAENNLYPIRIEPGTLQFKLIEALEEASERIEIKFNYDLREKDSKLRNIAGDDIPVQLNDYNGLFGICSTITNEALAGFTAKLQEKYGSYSDRILQGGLLPGDFTLFNETTQLAVVIITADESSKGVYDFTFIAQNAADVLTLTPLKEGFNYTDVIDNPIQLP